MRIVGTFVILFSSFFYVVSAQQTIKQYVQVNSIPVKSIDPLVTDFSDLERIGEAIGDAKVVMLGEQYHGDGASFFAKSRLVKYLHEKKGFNVLAFESDFFGLNYGWDGLMKTSPSLDSFLTNNIFRIWTKCDACTDLFYQYIPATFQTKNPLTVTGFDNQIIQHYSRKRLAAVLDSVFLALDIPITQHLGYRSIILPLIDSLTKIRNTGVLDTSLYNKTYFYIEEIRNQLKYKLGGNDFWNIVVNNLLAYVKEWVVFGSDPNSANRIRDEQMAKNLAWLSEFKFTNEKIIVWAHNAHVLKQPFAYAGYVNLNQVPMGYVYTKDSIRMKDTYIIGFDSYQGTTGATTLSTQRIIPLPDRKDFENWVDPILPYAFIDFKPYNKISSNSEEQFYMKGTDHVSSRLAWNLAFDGIYFIRNMFPCKKIN